MYICVYIYIYLYVYIYTYTYIYICIIDDQKEDDEDADDTTTASELCAMNAGDFDKYIIHIRTSKHNTQMNTHKYHRNAQTHAPTPQTK